MEGLRPRLSESGTTSLLTISFLGIRLPRTPTAILIARPCRVFRHRFPGPVHIIHWFPPAYGRTRRASFGAALGMICSKSWLIVQCATLAFGFVAVGWR
jgi:hypothetical protein